jgi:hypothetical protein
MTINDILAELPKLGEPELQRIRDWLDERAEAVEETDELIAELDRLVETAKTDKRLSAAEVLHGIQSRLHNHSGAAPKRD